METFKDINASLGRTRTHEATTLECNVGLSISVINEGGGDGENF